MAEPALRCAGLVKRFGARTVLHGADLDARLGEVIGLVGANGGAKTTLLRLAAGLIDADDGACAVFGRPPAQERQRIGYMPQALSLYPSLTVRENLRSRAALFGLEQPGRVAADAILRRGLAPHADTLVSALSGGWVRRAQFAMALLHAPPLVLLDEPTVGLDAASRQDLWREVLTLAAAGVALVVSTHDLAEAERFTRLVFLSAGRVLAAGSPGAVIAAAEVASYLFEGADPFASAALCQGRTDVIAAYPAMGALRVVLTPETPPAPIAAALGMTARAVPPSLDDAAQRLLRGGTP